MGEYILKRLISAVVVLFLVSLLSFSIMHVVPGDPAALIAGSEAWPKVDASIATSSASTSRSGYSLRLVRARCARRPRRSSILLGQGVSEAIVERLPVSFTLAAYALVITLVIGLGTGVFAAVRHNTWVDQACVLFALLGISLPNFWLGLMLIILFGVWLGWFPTGGYVSPFADFGGWLSAATLPALSLALMQVGLLARITRSTMLEVLGQDYIRTARAIGVTRFRIVARHAMKNVMIPVMTVIGIIVGLLVSGSVVIETVFSVPGIGRLIGSAILRRDYPVIQGGLLFTATLLVFINLVVDILYAYFDPRVRHAR